MGFSEDVLAARILIVDDQEPNIALLACLLEAAGYRRVESTRDARQVAELHRSNNYDLILLDLSMPYMNGFEVMEALKPIETEAYLPVLVITAEPAHKLKALKAGAKDFLAKPFDQVEVLTRIANMLEIRLLHKRLRRYSDSLEVKVEQRTSDLRAAEAQVGYLLNFDSVTGLPNRILLRDRFMRAQEHIADERNAILGVFIVDLSQLLAVREAMGIKIEQSLIIVMAHRLLGWAQRDDTVARYSDASFALLAIRRDADALAVAAGELLTVLDAPFKINDDDLHVPACIGIAIYPEDSQDFDVLMQAAEVSARRAQDSNGRYQFYMPGLNESASARLKLEGALRRALERDELCLHYQPQVALDSGAIVGVEALVRWQHPELGLVFPGDFIDLAEKTGLIVPIGTWVMREACRQMRAWQVAGLRCVPVAVNLSARQFSHDLVDTVAETLAVSGLPPGLLELELTESMSMHDPETALNILHKLKGMGVCLSIDDFGTGYSNLHYLKRFPLDKLKLDKSFVHELISEPHDLAIARAVIAMAHSLRLRVIAEGVETEGQRCLLTRSGCDEMQGYLFSKPLDAAGCAEYLREGRKLAPLPAGEQRLPVLLLVGAPGKWDALAEQAVRSKAVHCLHAASPAAAFEMLATVNATAVMVICDQAMPGFADTAFCSRLQQMYPAIACCLAGDTAEGLQQIDATLLSGSATA